MILKAQDFTADGRAVVLVDGRKFPLPGVIPGEVVEIRMEKSRPRLVRVAEASECRREPLCRLFPGCPGCSWQHISPQGQAFFKSSAVKAALGVEPESVWQGPETGWRWRSRFLVKKAGDMVYFGFPVSPRMLFDIWDCPDLPDAHRTLIEKLKRFFKDEKVTFYSRAKGTGKLRAVGFSGSPSPRNLIVSLVTAVSVRSRLLGQRIAALSPEISGVAEQEPRQVRGLFGEHHCFHSFAGVFHRMTPGAPWPENPFLHEALARWVSEIVLPGCEVAEYGAGYLFAPHIAGKSGSVTCVDAEPGVIPEISVNLELNNLPNASVALDNLADFSSTSRAEVCIVNLDRQGMSPETSRNMFAGRVAQVIAIGRDMARVKKAHRNLLDAGFSLKRVRAFDPAPAKPDVLAVTEYGR